MKIRLAVVDSDQRYKEQFISFFTRNYADRCEIYSFSSSDALLDHSKDNKIDVVLVSEDSGLTRSHFSKNTAFAFFSESSAVDTIQGERTICRYQKMDLIFKEILSLYSDLSTSVTSYKSLGEGKTDVLVFLSPAGGCGSTTAGAAAARAICAAGRKVLFLSLEQCACVDTLFTADGSFSMSDVIYAVKSNKSNLKLRLESMVKEDEGVFFYDSCPVALDGLEFSTEEVAQLFRELKDTGSYDVIIVAVDSEFNSTLYTLLQLCRAVVMVNDGSISGNAKFQKYYNALKILDSTQNLDLEGKMMVFYNKFSSKSGKVLSLSDVMMLGGLPRYEGASPREIAQEIAKSAVFQVFVK